MKNKRGVLTRIIAAAMLFAFTAQLFCACGRKIGEETAVVSVIPQFSTDAPTPDRTEAPTETATPAPTDVPTEASTDVPTEASTDVPTEAPTEAPTETPTEPPTEAPTILPTAAPTAFVTPTPAPTSAPTPTVRPTAAPTSAPTPTAKPTAAPTSAPTPVPTPKPTEAPGDSDYSIFDNFCFVGNSLLHGVHAYKAITNGRWLTKESLNVNSVYSAVAEGCSNPIMQELESGDHNGVVLHFGLNEVGWMDFDKFIGKYEKVLKDVHTRQPGAKLFVLAMLPVTKKQSANTENGITNERINALNKRIKSLVSGLDYAYYIVPPPELIGSDGALLDSCSGKDGMHLTGSATRTWAKQILREVKKLMK